MKGFGPLLYLAKLSHAGNSPRQWNECVKKKKKKKKKECAKHIGLKLIWTHDLADILTRPAVNIAVNKIDI